MMSGFLSPLNLFRLDDRTTVQRLTHIRDWRTRLQQLVVLLGCLAGTAYFAHHAIVGRHGFEVRQRLIARSSMLEFELKSLEAVRLRLARDVALLASEPPSRDITEEVARDVLGFAYPTDRLLRR
jgi:cell division protein FtsB